jgi:sulfatase modifying factor 1
MTTKIWYYGAAIFLGAIATAYIFGRVMKIKALERLKEAEERIRLERLNPAPQKLTQTSLLAYWLRLEDLDDYLFFNLNKEDSNELRESILKLEELISEQEAIVLNYDESPSAVLQKQYEIDRIIEHYVDKFEEDLPQWSKLFNEVEELKTSVYAKKEYLQTWLKKYNFVRIEYLKRLRGNLAQKWNMVYVEGGEWFGNQYDTKNYKVNDFYIAKFELTYFRWKNIYGKAPHNFMYDTIEAAYGISLYEAALFCNKLSHQYGLKAAYEIDSTDKEKIKIARNFNANGFRLATKEEWMYAAHGGQKSKGYKYAGSNKLGEVTIYQDNYKSWKTIRNIARREPNELGIYDMLGSAREWLSNESMTHFYLSPGIYQDMHNPLSEKYSIALIRDPLHFKQGFCGMRLLLPKNAIQE